MSSRLAHGAVAEACAPALAVLGQGRIGRLIADHARVAGFDVSVADVDDWEAELARGPSVVALSLNRGTDSVKVMRYLVSGAAPRPPVVIDLTTQSLPTARTCAELAGRGRISLHGGGLTGGEKGLREGKAVIFVGPTPIPTDIVRLLEPAGHIEGFETLEAAVTAKLLHNWVLLTTSWSLAIALAVAEEMGLDHHRLAFAISSGPAGRSIDDQSLFRDVTRGPATSYLSRLAAKDLEQLAESFPALVALAGGPMDQWRTAFVAPPTAREGPGSEPLFTTSLMDWVREQVHSATSPSSAGAEEPHR